MANTYTLYRIEVGAREDLPDPVAANLLQEMQALNVTLPFRARERRLYWLEAEFTLDVARCLTRELFSDSVVEQAAINEPLRADVNARKIEVIRKPGVMDPVVDSIRKALSDRKLAVGYVATGRQYIFYYAANQIVSDEELMRIARKLLANECIEEIYLDRPAPIHPIKGEAAFKLVTIPLLGKTAAELVEISRKGCLSLTADEMRAIQKRYEALGREPTDIELETIAQTWSEHCRHKTMRGAIEFTGPDGFKRYDNLLKETIFRATETIGHHKCLSVFKDNAGVVAFDDNWALTFKVETHNHPSAIEPYGGAETGIGGVIRDTMGTGLGAKPIANTDVFCFGMPDTQPEGLPVGALHPRRVMTGVVAGVRDYGNRMGIPTVNGAVHFDSRYVGNPLVYCGSLGLLPRDKIFKNANAGDLIVVLGGRTGRDGIHGATFSSIELSENSEMVSSGAVQIGNAIEEKKVLDVLLKARDAGLFTCITDCGAGGLSSAIGEMAEELGATVNLEKVPLKYNGLTYTEIWISEAQERMVVSVPPTAWPALEKLCRDEDVESQVIGAFSNDKILRLKYRGVTVGEQDMFFLHDGLPRIVRRATWQAPRMPPPEVGAQDVMLNMQAITGLDYNTLIKARSQPSLLYGPLLKKLLAHPTLASKQWIIRQYDHEVQGRSVIKPLVGVHDDGPSDAAVLTPILGSTRGCAIACGLCPQFTAYDPREMARLAVDECMRNLVSVGANPSNIFILDNFAWGNTSKPDQLGSLVLACEGATEAALAYSAPFISGKDSLNNEYVVGDSAIAIPGTLLISGIGMIDDIRACITMDLKQVGDWLYLVGLTRDELCGSHFNLLTNAPSHVGHIPRVDLSLGAQVHHAIHTAIMRSTARACHDLSEGGLAVAAAEMAFAGNLGITFEMSKAPVTRKLSPQAILFSESPSRYLVEVPRNMRQDFEEIFAGLPHACIGEVIARTALQCFGPERELWLDEPLDALKRAWQSFNL